MKRFLVSLFALLSLGFALQSWAKAPSLSEAELAKFGMKQSQGKTPGFLLLDFYSASCGVCQQTEPYLKEMQKRLKPDVQFVRVDSDKQPSQMEHFDIEGTPGYVLFDRTGKPLYKMQRHISMEVLFTQLQRYSNRLAPVDVPKSLLEGNNSILTAAERAKPHFTLVAIHPEKCDTCKAKTPFLNGMAIAKSTAPQLNIVTWNPAAADVTPLLKKYRWPQEQSYVLIDPEQHELVVVKGDAEPKFLWQTISMLMDSGLEDTK